MELSIAAPYLNVLSSGGLYSPELSAKAPLYDTLELLHKIWILNSAYSEK